MKDKSEFEKVIQGLGYIPAWDGDCYLYEEVEVAWQAWQAAREQEGGEAVVVKDAYDGAREDLQIWKKRALESEKLLQEEIESNARLVEVCNDLTGPTHMGEPVLPPRQGAQEAKPIAYTNGSQLFYLWDEEGEGKMFAEREGDYDIALYTHPPQSQGVPEGYVLAPKSMCLTKEDVEFIVMMTGWGDEDQNDAEGVLWVGPVEDDDGNQTYGLNISCAECMEEGAIQLVQFDEPAATPEAEWVKPTGRHHNLKTDSSVFRQSLAGLKPWEIRWNDREFSVGDTVTLQETENTGKEMAEGAPLVFTGRTISGVIGYLLAGPIYGLSDGWCIFTLQATPPQEQ